MKHLRDRANSLYFAQIVLAIIIAIVMTCLIGICGSLERNTITFEQALLAIIIGMPILFGLVKIELWVNDALEDTYADMDMLEQRHIDRALRNQTPYHH